MEILRETFQKGNLRGAGVGLVLFVGRKTYMTVNELINKLKELPQFGNNQVGCSMIGTGVGFKIEDVAFIREPIIDGATQYVLIELCNCCEECEDNCRDDI